MKKVFLTIALMLGLIVNASANEVSILDKASERLTTLNDSVLTSKHYEMLLNDKTKQFRRAFLLDDQQSDILFNYHNGVTEGFAHLNEIKDDVARQTYFNNLINYWRQGAELSFYATERLDAGKMYRKYWNCVNQTLKNKGYIDEYGKFTGK